MVDGRIDAFEIGREWPEGLTAEALVTSFGSLDRRETSALLVLIAEITSDGPAPAGLSSTRRETKSSCSMSSMRNSGELRISQRGQMSLPASARRRWGLAEGGEVGYLDLGDALVLVPGGIDALRRRLLEAITDADWADARAGFGDDDLATE